MKISGALLFFAACLPAVAQSPQVPTKMNFADIVLIIRDDARKQIQQDVDALTRSPKHYAIKAERAKTYFPIIEKIFREENVPDDLKFLVLQESALIADAVSVSDAVGFWQFKDFTAIEMGLRVDREIDERMNIVSSTRAAARYLKKNNSMFDNWLYALQAYQMGAGGVMRSVKNTHAGAKRMEITGDTYWYVKKFLAHMIAFDEGVRGKPEIEIVTLENRSGKSLKSVAREVDVSLDELLAYNKWTKSGDVPNDRTYAVIIPAGSPVRRSVSEFDAVARTEPAVSKANTAENPMTTTRINGVRAVAALEKETPQQFAVRVGIRVSEFLRWNDMRHTSSSANLKGGQFYFVARKRVRATDDFHKLGKGETLWDVSQRYGVKLRKLRRFNRVRDGQTPEAGTMLYLASRRPRIPAEAEPIDNALAVDEDLTFNWAMLPDSAHDSAATEQFQLPGEVLVISNDSKEDIPDSTNILENDVAVGEVTAGGGPTTLNEHVVESGETLYSISKRYAVTVLQLAEWNDLNINDGIKVGQVLKVSGNQTTKNEVEAAAERDGMAGRAAEGWHEVKPSDTLYSIARQYGVTIKELMDWNNKTDFALAIGEKLRIQPPR